MGNVVAVFAWLREILKDKTGYLLLGIVIGILPSAAISYIFYKQGDTQYNNLIRERERYDQLLEDKRIWQERAFNAESTCLGKIRDMIGFFQEVEGMYKTTEENYEELLELNREQQESLENIEGSSTSPPN